jgi:electron transport complex protein RnfG
MKDILKPALSLFLIAAVFTVLLGLVRSFTLEPIEKQRRSTQEKTIKEVLAEAEDFRELSAERKGSIVKILEGINGGKTIGYVIELAPVGYSGEISMMVGISKDREEISGMRILKLSETPGLGALAAKEKFYKRFDGKKLVPLKVVKTPPGAGEIEAITSATITSKAVTDAVNEAIEWYRGSSK